MFETLIGRFRKSTTPTAPGTRLVALNLEPFVVPADLVADGVCGGYDGHAFKTTVRLVADKLDGMGFVIENQEFIRLVREAFAVGWLRASCEQLADGIIRVAADNIGSSLVAVEVTVFGQSAHITSAWERGQTVPNFPRKATRAEITATPGAIRRLC